MDSLEPSTTTLGGIVADVTFLRRVPGRRGWTYFYKCSCSSGTEFGEISIAASNHNEAEVLAEMQCAEICGEARSSVVEVEFSKRNSDLKPLEIENVFIVDCKEATEEFIIASLCTGDDIYIPTGLIKSFRFIGRCDGDTSSQNFFRLEFDVENQNTWPVIQLSSALQRKLNDESKAYFDTEKNVENLTIKIACSGRACTSSHSYYNSPHDIIDFQINRIEGCSAWGLTRIGPRQLRISHAGLGGTPCSSSYFGQVWVDIAINRS